MRTPRLVDIIRQPVSLVRLQPRDLSGTRRANSVRLRRQFRFRRLLGDDDPRFSISVFSIDPQAGEAVGIGGRDGQRLIGV